MSGAASAAVASRYDMRSKKSARASRQPVTTLAAFCSFLYLDLDVFDDNDVLCCEIEGDVLSEVELYFLLLSLEIFLTFDLLTVVDVFGPTLPSSCWM